MFLILKLSHKPFHIDLLNNKVETEVVSVLENKLFYIPNNFVCYSLQQFSTMVNWLNRSECFYEHSLNGLAAVLVILSYLEQVVGNVVVCVMIYLAARDLVKLRFDNRSQTHQFCNCLAVDFRLFHHLGSFGLFCHKFK